MLYFLCFFALVSCIVQRASTEQDGGVYPKLNSSERFGNFSVELLYHVGEFQTGNFIISPFNAWSVVAPVAEGALRSTRLEITNALRLYKKTDLTRSMVQGVLRGLQLNSTGTVQLARFNAILIDKSKRPETDFREICRLYDTFNIPVNLMDARVTTSRTNKAVSVATNGLITKIVDENDFSEPQMIIMSAAYFKGRWSASFKASSSFISPFYDSNGIQTGQVNMMYNRFTYPLADIEDLQASVIELPYGPGRFSLIVMLPNKGVSLKRMIMNTQKVPLDVVFSELRLDQQQHGDDLVDCLLPRFKIDSNLELKNVLKRLGIFALFNETNAALARIARFNTHVTKVIHKTVIEVVEEGIPGTGSTPELDATGVTFFPKFEANRPFAFFVLEKTTNTVLFEGLYRQPYLDLDKPLNDVKQVFN